MRFLLDESADARLGPYLVARGHEVTQVAKDYPAGLPDTAVLALAHRQRRILIANDRDFGELVFKHRQSHTGVICSGLAPMLRWSQRSPGSTMFSPTITGSSTSSSSSPPLMYVWVSQEVRAHDERTIYRYS